MMMGSGGGDYGVDGEDEIDDHDDGDDSALQSQNDFFMRYHSKTLSYTLRIEKSNGHKTLPSL